MSLCIYSKIIVIEDILCTPEFVLLVLALSQPRASEIKHS
jgi:hypothetical protein